MYVRCLLNRTLFNIVLFKIKLASTLTTFQISAQVYWAVKWNSCSFTSLYSIFNLSSSNWLPSLQKHAHLSFKVQFLLIPLHGIFNGIIDRAHAIFSSAFAVCFWIHWFAQRKQTRVNAQKHYICPHLLSCPCYTLTVYDISSHYWSLGMMNSCSDLLVCTQEIIAFLKKNLELLIWITSPVTATMALLSAV